MSLPNFLVKLKTNFKFNFTVLIFVLFTINIGFPLRHLSTTDILYIIVANLIILLKQLLFFTIVIMRLDFVQQAFTCPFEKLSKIQNVFSLNS